ncbi:hypothetical protein M1B72_09255 [Geomonas paludis]|uniref:DUF2274 domain-containing protein n=1 Tax=Geomonas paludis TaxID=2740185 RepID=A0ABY4LIQ6_9BACT|nr:hypothetical protein [Geomonas paludis]UPU37877.1 hypothetical protein M1B72_09255 [Geomonas paludis]
MKKNSAETTELRIRPLPTPPEKQKIAFKLPRPTLSKFDAYLAAYADIYGVEPDRDFIVDRIFTSFFESDHAFVAYLKRETPHPDKKKDKKSVLGGENAVLGESAQI